MILRLPLLLCALLAFSMAEEVDVIEAVSGTQQAIDDLLETDQKHQSAPVSAQNREDAESHNSDQLAEETGEVGDQDTSGSIPKHNFLKPQSAPSRGHPSLNRGPSPPPPSGKYHHNVVYHGPPPPPPQSGQQQPAPQQSEAMDKVYSAGPVGNALGDPWPNSASADMPKIVSLDVKCEKNSMKVFLGFDKPFFGIVFSKGHYSNGNCVHLPAGLGRTSVNFEIGIHACGTTGNTENGLYGYGADSGSGTYFENIVVVQYDPQVQEVWDQARKLRCTWHDQYEKSVTFRPFPVDMLDVVRTDFAGDNVGCWMQIQVGKGPWASEVSGLVKIGQTMTMVLAIKDDDSKFDMLVRNCMAHDGKRAPIQLVDQKGCVTRGKLMSRFTKIKNFGASASVLSYAHFQAFKFPDSMEVHFQCTIQICRYQCPDQCSDSNAILNAQHGNLLAAHHPAIAAGPEYGPPSPPSDLYARIGSVSHPRDERRFKTRHRRAATEEEEVGVNRIIKVVSTGDLTFAIDESNNSTTMVFPTRTVDPSSMICMTTVGFSATLMALLGILLVSCLVSAYLCLRIKSMPQRQKNAQVARTNPTLHPAHKTKTMHHSMFT
ncbi:uncharacterized protein LOC126900814 [Daktulosphaira vitifoliae]|uniref:uncharacterized protein LOC126900814 n=1 Tax=Daktulosphaira vitifoliae TaxID=58002 RepID=UPI0021A97B06|nr:uncharacterized protein LOC126900814 [Daktulosphaira vitifoliae]